MGSALTITLPHSLGVNSELEVTISYVTTSDCSALQWLTKE